MISVIVPVYKGRLMLDACLQAIFRSADCPKFEVILVDDSVLRPGRAGRED